MQAFSFISKHAAKRVSIRTDMTSAAVAAQLDQGLFVDLGKVPGFSRQHLLFYSELDDECFVAIRDSVVGTVVTVLTLEYHANLAWPVSSAQCENAKQIFLSARQKAQEAASAEAAAEALKASREPASDFHIRIVMLLPAGRQLDYALPKCSSEPYGGDVDVFIKSGEPVRRALAYAQRGNIPFARIIRILVRKTRKDLESLRFIEQNEFESYLAAVPA